MSRCVSVDLEIGAEDKEFMFNFPEKRGILRLRFIKFAIINFKIKNYV